MDLKSLDFIIEYNQINGHSGFRVHKTNTKLGIKAIIFSDSQKEADEFLDLQKSFKRK